MPCVGNIVQYRLGWYQEVVMGIKNEEKRFILDFMEAYHSLPALRDVRSKEYIDRVKK